MGPVLGSRRNQRRRGVRRGGRPRGRRRRRVSFSPSAGEGAAKLRRLCPSLQTLSAGSLGCIWGTRQHHDATSDPPPPASRWPWAPHRRLRLCRSDMSEIDDAPACRPSPPASVPQKAAAGANLVASPDGGAWRAAAEPFALPHHSSRRSSARRIGARRTANGVVVTQQPAGQRSRRLRFTVRPHQRRRHPHLPAQLQPADDAARIITTHFTCSPVSPGPEKAACSAMGRAAPPPRAMRCRLLHDLSSAGSATVTPSIGEC